MEAKERPFAFIQDVEIIRIPFFQRNYVWDETNWQPLLDDLLEIDKNQFLGSLILKQQTVASGEPREVLIIDGQQRLTTISILFKCLCDIAVANGPLRTIEKAKEDILFYRKNKRSEDLFVKMIHSRIDKSSYDKVVTLPAADIMQLPASNMIIKCYQYYYIKLLDVPEDLRNKLFDRLADNRESIWVVIDLGKQDNEQTIFDTINSAGVRLSYADTIKNSLFQQALNLAEDESQDREKVLALYEEYWVNTFEADEECRSYWQREAQTIRIKRNNLEIFLHSFAIVNGFYSPAANKLEDLPLEFRNKTEQMDFSQIKNFIKDIARLANLYRQKIMTFDNDTMFEYSDDEQRLFHILENCNVSTFHPYLLYLYAKHENNQEALITKFKALESFVIRQYITQKSTRAYTVYCADFIKDDENVLKRSAETTDGEVRAKLSALNNKQAALVLFWIELYRRHQDPFQALKMLKFAYSLEHILPQKWQTHWRDVPITDESGNVIEDREAATDYRTRMCYAIGNMTLLNARLNASVSNSAYSVKINGNPNGSRTAKKGIKDYSDLTITKDIIKLFDAGDTVWDEPHIVQRTKALTEEFLTIWQQ